jgi:hypothetical protein
MGKVRALRKHEAAQATSQESHAALEEGYLQRAADREQEMEAEEWTEGLIGCIDELVRIPHPRC